MKKALFIMLSAALIVCATVAGTLAWLTDTTDRVVNTFTVGDINITLTESGNLDLKMVPGRTITKDPKVTVKEGSEACWLFVKVVKSGNFDSFMTFEMADGWTALGGHEGVYWREVAATTADTDISVLKDNKVTVRDTVTKTMLEGVKNADGTPNENAPTLTFTAYAVQKDGINDAATAWRKVNP
ncbi:MAG: SipW-dependent-type signal peptide-containing protein [Eubacteriales bacterium]|nr:SipW-dependent-type signal peptide-containing protein [Candidatus Colimorpha enterica]